VVRLPFADWLVEIASGYALIGSNFLERRILEVCWRRAHVSVISQPVLAYFAGLAITSSQ